jgi:hypothetical protein
LQRPYDSQRLNVTRKVKAKSKAQTIAIRLLEGSSRLRFATMSHSASKLRLKAQGYEEGALLNPCNGRIERYA